MHILENRWELMRILLQTKDGRLNLFTKPQPEARESRFVPIFGSNKFGSRSRRKDRLHR